MSTAAPRLALARPERRSVLAAARPWIVMLLVAAALPFLFRNYATGRDNGFMISMFSQMAMMVIFALSFNMLMGEAGLLSFCHAVFFGFGAYCVAHFLNNNTVVPIELLPLVGGLCGLGLAVIFGAMATKQRTTAFAMITFGIGQLAVTAAIMFTHFFGGEGGITTDRQNAWSLLGVNYAHGLQVYFLILGWALIAALGMFYLRGTPLGRMVNACRDNYERAQFVGYDPRMVRFLQFSLAGFFAGIGGALYCITYEIVTFDAVNAPLSGNALLMAYIGGVGSFVGPVIGAILITALQSGLSLLSNSWLVYVGLLFIAMVTFAPTGITGLWQAHAPIARAGRLGALALPYARLAVPALLTLAGFVALVEMLSFATIGASEGKTLSLFGLAPNVYAASTWAVALGWTALALAWLTVEGRRFRAVWTELMTGLAPPLART
ncbi:MAG TPA: branched-chain amino acid ABC transporter permease [Acetobacteraceae bacterium]|nr:branched-chain amino acid ABC transporter permease [Acetobacteraceae bacterium]